MKFSDLVRSLDYLAPDVTLNVNGKSSVKTYLGSVLWLLSTGCFIASMVVLLSDYLDTTSPRINLENSSVQNYPKIDVRENHMIPVILVYLDEVTAIPAEEVPQYATFLMQQITYKASQNAVGDYETTAEYSTWSYVPCSSVQDSHSAELTLINSTLGDLAGIIPKYGLCANYSLTNTSVSGKGTDTIYSGVYFGAYPCTLDDASLCKPVEDVKRIGFTYVVGEVSLNLGNYERPVSFTYAGDEFYYLDPALHNYYTYKLMLNEVSNAKGFLQDSKKLATFATVDHQVLQVISRDPSVITCSREGLTNLLCAPYVSKWLISGGRTIRYDRDYKDFVELIGDVGGAREFIFSLAFILYYTYHMHRTKHVLLSAVLSLHEQELKRRRSTLDKPSRKVFDQAVEQATSLIEESLDVVTIAKKALLLDSVSDSVLPDHDMDQITRRAVAKVLPRIDIKSDSSFTKQTTNSGIRPNLQSQLSLWSRRVLAKSNSLSAKQKLVRITRISNIPSYPKTAKPGLSSGETGSIPAEPELANDSLPDVPQDPKSVPSADQQIIALLYGDPWNLDAKKILHPPPFTK